MDFLKVEIKISEDIEEAFAVIYTPAVSEEVLRAVALLEMKENIITAINNERISILQPKDIFMVRTENTGLYIYCRNKRYQSKKRLYEIKQQLGSDFMQISKSTIVNLKEMDYVQPFFNGSMEVVLKNGSKDYISRKYLPDLKKYLGLSGGVK